jgi:isoleucyl-tRNA synthetase
LTDRITIFLEEDTPFLNDIKKNEEYISSEVLSNKIEIVSSLSNFNEIEIDEVNFKLNIEKN